MGNELSSGFVILMGMGTVFVGLICIIIICSITSWLCKTFIKEDKVGAAVPAVVIPSAGIANKGAIVAAVSAAIAEDLGADASNIRIHSFKRL
jgi:Na+-transporting methylmalonyl-CoA/oxaloacetate decarboxylase gamma subunit